MTGLLLNNYSIAAICRETGQCGVAVASAIPCVGSISAFAGPGVGAVATQSWCNPYLGIAAQILALSPPDRPGGGGGAA